MKNYTKQFFESSIIEVLKNNPIVYYSFTSQDKKDYWKSFYKKALVYFIVKYSENFHIDVLSSDGKGKNITLEVCSDVDYTETNSINRNFELDINLHKRYLIELLIAERFRVNYYD